MGLRQRVLESGAFHDVDGNAVGRQILRCLPGARADDDARDVRASVLRHLLRRRQRGERRLLEMSIRLLSHHQDRRHDQITFASECSFCTSVWTSGTFTPAARCGGDSTLTTLTFGTTSTPSCCGVISAMGFFFAFMMLGSDA